jgi:amino acid transporter
VIGWIVLLAITFAANDPDAINATAADEALPTAVAIFVNNLPAGLVLVVMTISSVGQLFCGMSCVTSGSRMLFAFSRDRAVPGHQLWTKLNKNRTPYMAVLGMCLFAALVTLPALYDPIAFFAVVSITVIGLYIAYVIPSYLRLRLGDSFVPGPWNNGQRYKWMNAFAVIWTIIITVIFSLPFVPAGVPGNPDFDWASVNYAPLMVFGVIILVGLWWILFARKTFTGPVRQVDAPVEDVNLA